MNSTFMRKIQTLRFIEHSSNKKGVKELHALLVGEGYQVDIRSVQRDVKALANVFDIENDGNKDQPGWFWKKNAERIEFPNMDPSVALTFKMAEHYLKGIMPPSAIKNLSHYFYNAQKLLKNHKENKLAHWDDKVAIISRSQQLIAPNINEQLLEKIYAGLLSETQLKVHYNPKYSMPSDYTINPLAVVTIDEVIYLVGTVWKYTDIRQFALHRFVEVENTECEIFRTESFDLQDYIKQGGFQFKKNSSNDNSEPSIALQFNAEKWVVDYLQETPLSEDQTVTEASDNSKMPHTLSATVLNTSQLRWWLIHYGASIEIIAPTELRDQFKTTVAAMSDLYK